MNADLTHDEATALIAAQSNLIEELRVRWMVLLSDEYTADTRLVNRAWLAIGSKPFSNRFFEESIDVLQGKTQLYPETVNAEHLKQALIKMNGQERT